MNADANTTQTLNLDLQMSASAPHCDYQRYPATAWAAIAGASPTTIVTAPSSWPSATASWSWKATHRGYYDADCKRAYYMSLEFSWAQPGNAMINLGIEEEVERALQEEGLTLSQIEEYGLGNGGLGRLAACFLDSCATLQLPVVGFASATSTACSANASTRAVRSRNPTTGWCSNPELERPEFSQRVKFKGHTEFYRDEKGDLRVKWAGTSDVMAVPYDTPIPGYKNGTINTLRRKAAATEEFNLQEFNEGDYAAAIEDKNKAENISMVLYLNDKSENGKELRLRQQYLASASLQDVMRRWCRAHDDFTGFEDKNCFQLNDTHPTVAVAELMRLLMDDFGLGWGAWEITTKSMAYTNHTPLPEALEKWPVAMFRNLLPRLLEIIQINARFMRAVANKWPGDNERQSRMSIIQEGDDPQVRMAYPPSSAPTASTASPRCTPTCSRPALLRLYELWPDKFNNKTNGVTQRRWMAWCNPACASCSTRP